MRAVALLAQNLPRCCLSDPRWDRIARPDEGTVHFQATAPIEIGRYLRQDTPPTLGRSAPDRRAQCIRTSGARLRQTSGEPMLEEASVSQGNRITGCRAIALAALVRTFPASGRRSLFNEAIIVGPELCWMTTNPRERSRECWLSCQRPHTGAFTILSASTRPEQYSALCKTHRIVTA